MKTIEWTKVDWSQSDTALAAVLGCTRQNVSAARLRLQAPPSPEKRGGDRKSQLFTGPDAAPTTATINTTKGQKRRWHQKQQDEGKTFDEWVNSTLDAAAK